jgi:hypothetical protein
MREREISESLATLNGERGGYPGWIICETPFDGQRGDSGTDALWRDV